MIYATNSAQYLDFLAATKTRDEITNDPKLCKLLEDPYIKDNVEVALKYAEAECGDLTAKTEFVQCLLANGPELDADTILHYRDIILTNPVYSSIVNTSVCSIKAITEIRETTYEKEDDGNCFTTPCNYLGKLAPDLLILSDYRAAATTVNFWAKLVKDIFKTSTGSEEKTDNGTPVEATRAQDDPDYEKKYNGVLPSGVKTIPTVEEGVEMMNGIHAAGQVALANTLANSKHKINPKQVGGSGDSTVMDLQESVAPNIRANIYAKLGDCYRLVEHMRKFNPYDPSQNLFQTKVDPIGPKEANGTPVAKPVPKEVNSIATPYVQNAANAVDGK